MKTILMLSLIFVAFACEKKKEAPKPPATTTGGAVITPTVTPADTIKRVLKQISVSFKTYCNYEGNVKIFLDDKENATPYDSIYEYKTKTTITLVRGTKLRYLHFLSSSYQSMQDVNGHLKCQYDFTLSIDGQVKAQSSGIGLYYGDIDLYK